MNCVEGITANEGRLAQMVGSSVGVITALTPYIGYAAAATLAKQALAGQRDVADLVVESGLLTREEVTNLLALERISGQPMETAPIPVLPPVQPMMPPPANPLTRGANGLIRAWRRYSTSEGCRMAALALTAARMGMSTRGGAARPARAVDVSGAVVVVQRAHSVRRVGRSAPVRALAQSRRSSSSNAASASSRDSAAVRRARRAAP